MTPSWRSRSQWSQKLTWRGGPAGAEDGSRDHHRPSATTDHGASANPGAQDGPTRDHSDGSSRNYRDGSNPGPKDSHAGGSNSLGTNDELPAIPNCVTTNDHACTADLCSSCADLCSSNHLLCST